LSPPPPAAGGFAALPVSFSSRSTSALSASRGKQGRIGTHGQIEFEGSVRPRRAVGQTKGWGHDYEFEIPIQAVSCLDVAIRPRDR
jgi:hypothetical protein